VLNLLDSIERGELDASVSLAIASREGLIGTDRLLDRGFDVAIATVQDMKSSEGDMRTNAWLDAKKPDIICLCGYLRLLEIRPWMEGRVLNIHPALLPKYGGKGMFGMHVHRAVLDHNETVSGCTVHLVDDAYDHGPTILQRTCAVQEGDTPQDLADRVFSLECEAYPQAITKLAATIQP
jgi:phosphoribosylglycinamide formyltransferase-1